MAHGTNRLGDGVAAEGLVGTAVVLPPVPVQSALYRQ